MGYQYSIVYKPGKENRVADALSRQPDETKLQFLAFTQVQFQLLDTLRLKNTTSPFFVNLYKSMEMNLAQFEEYEVRDGLLLYKGKLILDPKSLLVTQVLKECHSTLMGVMEVYKRLQLRSVQLLPGQESSKM